MNDNQENEMKEAESQSDLRKFAVFLAVIFVVVLVMAVISEPLGERVFPAILGLNDDDETTPDSALPDPVNAGGIDGTVSQELLPLLDQGGFLDLKDAIQHEVREGETIYEIAAEFGVTVADIAFVNRLVSPEKIAKGDVLVIPIME
jgi:hypothetical protein